LQLVGLIGSPLRPILFADGKSGVGDKRASHWRGSPEDVSAYRTAVHRH
jgi:hypothetical protein